jgi:protein-disulfide isomerase
MSSKIDQAIDVTVIATCLFLLTSFGLDQWKARSLREKSKPLPMVENIQARQISLPLANAPIDGSRAATVAVVEFADFECPSCGHYAREVWPRLREEFMKTGKVRFAFRNLPLAIHPLAEQAASAGDCAEAQGRFWEMHDRLFADQALARPDLMTAAKAIQLDSRQFETCLSNGNNQQVIMDKSEAKKLGINATPTFLVGLIDASGQVQVLRKLNGALPFEIFAATLKEIIATIPPQGAVLLPQQPRH